MKAIGSSILRGLAAALCLVATGAASAQAAPGGLYLGYYHEDRATNPEDAMPGAVHFALPEGDAAFSGTLFFTYVGCQSASLGAIEGTKAGLALAAQWSGPVDGTPQQGALQGTYDPAVGSYSGTYTVAGGKQFFNIPSCISYYIAPGGTWEVFPVGVNSPPTFEVSLVGTVASWPAVAGGAEVLLSIIDTTVAANPAGGNAVRWQAYFPSAITSYDIGLAGQGLRPGDALSVATFDPAGKRLTFGSKALPAQGAPVVEFHHPEFGHYFVTNVPAEIAGIDAGTFAGWQRTGQGFGVYLPGSPGTSNVCRFFSASFAPKSSHFYTPFASECGIVMGDAHWQFEGEVFAVVLPGSAGECAGETIPLYRLYNDGQSGAPNHRYTTSATIRAQMLAQGWIAEGAGDLGVIACVPANP